MIIFQRWPFFFFVTKCLIAQLIIGSTTDQKERDWWAGVWKSSFLLWFMDRLLPGPCPRHLILVFFESFDGLFFFLILFGHFGSSSGLFWSIIERFCSFGFILLFSHKTTAWTKVVFLSSCCACPSRQVAVHELYSPHCSSKIFSSSPTWFSTWSFPIWCCWIRIAET